MSMANPIAWWEALGRPLRALPRWAAIFALLATALSLAWSAVAVDQFLSVHWSSAKRRKPRRPTRTSRFTDTKRVVAGEDYYDAAAWSSSASTITRRAPS